MSRFIGLIITVVAVAALVGAALGWRFPFQGQNRAANQLSDTQEAAEGQPTRTRVQRANQPAARAQNNNQTNLQAQAPDGTVNPEEPNTQNQPANTNQPVPALW